MVGSAVTRWRPLQGRMYVAGWTYGGQYADVVRTMATFRLGQAGHLQAVRTPEPDLLPSS